MTEKFTDAPAFTQASIEILLKLLNRWGNIEFSAMHFFASLLYSLLAKNAWSKKGISPTKLLHQKFY